MSRPKVDRQDVYLASLSKERLAGESIDAILISLSQDGVDPEIRGRILREFERRLQTATTVELALWSRQAGQRELRTIFGAYVRRDDASPVAIKAMFHQAFLSVWKGDDLLRQLFKRIEKSDFNRELVWVCPVIDYLTADDLVEMWVQHQALRLIEYYPYFPGANISFLIEAYNNANPRIDEKGIFYKAMKPLLYQATEDELLELVQIGFSSKDLMETVLQECLKRPDIQVTQYLEWADQAMERKFPATFFIQAVETWFDRLPFQTLLNMAKVCKPDNKSRLDIYNKAVANCLLRRVQEVDTATLAGLNLPVWGFTERLVKIYAARPDAKLEQLLAFGQGAYLTTINLVAQLAMIRFRPKADQIEALYAAIDDRGGAVHPDTQCFKLYASLSDSKRETLLKWLSDFRHSTDISLVADVVVKRPDITPVDLEHLMVDSADYRLYSLIEIYARKAGSSTTKLVDWFLTGKINEEQWFLRLINGRELSATLVLNILKKIQKIEAHSFVSYRAKPLKEYLASYLLQHEELLFALFEKKINTYVREFLTVIYRQTPKYRDEVRREAEEATKAAGLLAR